MAFYDGAMFPLEYRGDAFVALHGSWNRAKRTGYKVVRIRFKDGKPLGGYEDFLTGFMLGEDQPDVWGRPVSLLVLRDGSLLVADDGGGKIWRLTYQRRIREGNDERPPAGPVRPAAFVAIRPDARVLH